MTAVEWLEKRLLGIVFLDTEYSTIEYEKRIDKAKEMEKQQIIDAWEDGQNSFPTINAEKYYNEQFKNK